MIDYKELSALLFPDVTMTEEDVEKMFPAREGLPEGAVISRMAPSPTGFVHLGNLVQGLTSERMCHQSGGVLYLRVEDTDAKREVAGAVETLIESLSHYGICFDEGATVDGDNASPPGMPEWPRSAAASKRKDFCNGYDQNLRH